MNANLEHLVVLQAQDLELARFRNELAEAPRRVLAARNALAAAQAVLARNKEQRGAEETLRRHQESDIATHRAKSQRLRRSLDAAANAQQVAAFEREIEFTEAAVATLEEEAFASLERTEVFEAERVPCETAVARAQTAVQQEEARATTVKAQHTATINGLERERAQLRPQIAERWLAVYDRLVKTRGTAVAEALGTATSGKCAACQMGIRPQRWQDLIGRDHFDEIFHCESCGRLLFWDPRRDTPRSWAAGERLITAQTGAGNTTGSASAAQRGGR